MSGWLSEDQSVAINYEIIYYHIMSDMQCGGHLFKHLLRKGKDHQSRSNDMQSCRGLIKKRISIDERPHVVDDKSRVGD
jgi:IS30 family transposase